MRPAKFMLQTLASAIVIFLFLLVGSQSAEHTSAQNDTGATRYAPTTDFKIPEVKLLDQNDSLQLQRRLDRVNEGSDAVMQQEELKARLAQKTERTLSQASSTLAAKIQAAHASDECPDTIVVEKRRGVWWRIWKGNNK